MLEVSGKNIKAAITTIPNEEKKIKVEMHTKIGNLNGEVNIYIIYVMLFTYMFYIHLCYICVSYIHIHMYITKWKF